jgi:transcriptional regulator with AAA-type ATPase domain
MYENQSEDTSSIPILETAISRSPAPGILVAYRPSLSTISHDRFSLAKLPFVFGRDKAACDAVFFDKTVSGRHFRIIFENGKYHVEDMGSRNGTYLNGVQIFNKTRLKSGDVIRIGQSVLAFHEDVMPMLPAPKKPTRLPGRFHVFALLDKLERVITSGDHILITGPSGTGKELVADAVRQIVTQKSPSTPFIVHNAADFSSESEAIATLYGVESRAFTGVAERKGLIETANGGVLFLDEAHLYPPHVQSSLNRGMETGEFRKSGDSKIYKSSFRLILATNKPPPDFGVTEDLRGRTQLVAVPPLEERRADIPDIFNHLLVQKLSAERLPVDSVFECLGADHYETLCIGCYTPENVRALRKPVHLLVGDIKRGTPARAAVRRAFSEQFGAEFVELRIKKRGVEIAPDLPSRTVSIQENRSPNSKYEQNKALIETLYREHDGNVKAVERVLVLDYNIKVTYRWLNEYIKNIWQLTI